MASPETSRVPSSAANRIRLHDNNTALAARREVLNSSTKGWSPLQIHKRSSSNTTSPLIPQGTGDSMSSVQGGGPRRTSGSFRHMATNSLVANSPFKNLSTREGQLSNGIGVSPSRVIHERRTPNRSLGQAPATAQGSGSTPRSAIGLGISTKRSAVSGTRRVSGERKVSAQRTSGERKVSGSKGRRVSGSKENESPPVMSKKKRLPRQSMAYKALVENEYVTHSPFVERRSNSGSSQQEEPQEVMASPPQRRRVSSGTRRASPSNNLAAGRTSMSPSSSPSLSQNAVVVPSPLREEHSPAVGTPNLSATPGRTPTKSSLASASKRLLGPRQYGQESPTRKTVTFQHVPEVKEYDVPSADTSLNDSYVYEQDQDDDWTDEAEHEDDWMRNVVNNDISFDEDNVGNESATANFMDEIFGDDAAEDVVESEAPAFADHDRFEIPMEQSFDQQDIGSPLFQYYDPSLDDVPPSPTHQHTFTPHLNPGKQPDLPHNEDHTMLLNADAHQPATMAPREESPGPHAHQDGPLFDPFLTIQTATEVMIETTERTEDGVPLGRTSHHERIQARRLLATQSLGLGFPGALPKAGSPLRVAPDSDSDGSPNIPFKALPTASEREGDDVFGAVIASPASKADSARKVSNTSHGRRVSGRQVSDVPELQGTSRRMAQFKATKGTPKKESETPNRGLPRPPPPAPAAIDVPSPVQYTNYEPQSESEVEAPVTPADEVRNAASAYLDLDYALPSVTSSPLMCEVSVVEEAPRPRVSDIAPQLPLPVSEYAPQLGSPSFEDTQLEIDVDSSSPGEDMDEPLTPPRRTRDEHEEREESPRIPSFDLGDLSIEMPESELSVQSDATLEPPKLTTFITSPSPSPAPNTPTSTTFSPGHSHSPGFSPTTPTHTSAPASPWSGGDSPLATPPRVTAPLSTPSRRAAPPAATPPRTPGSPATRSRAGSSSPLSTPYRHSISGPATPSRVTSPLASPPVNAPRPMEFGPEPSRDAAEASTNTLVRQRISREAIRKNVDKRMAAAELATPRRGSESASFDSPSSSANRVESPGRVTFAPPAPAYARHRRGMSTSSLDSEASRSPSARPVSAPPGQLSNARPLSALSRLQNADDDSPRSALEKIAASFGGDSDSDLESPVSQARTSTAHMYGSPSKMARPVRILSKTETSYPPQASSSGSIVNTAISTAQARKARRRSASMGEMEASPAPARERHPTRTKKTPRVSLGLGQSAFAMDSVRQELDQIGSQRSYRVRDNHRVVRATYTDGLRPQAGDLEDGSRRVWRPATQADPELKAFKERTASATSEAVAEEEPKTLVFVKVLGIEALNMPLPKETTFFTIRVSNGVDTILTPYVPLENGAVIHREYCLTELENSEFSLSMEVRKDMHILALERALKAPVIEPTRLAPPPPPQAARAESPVSSLASRSGFRAFFSSPRKMKHQRSQSSLPSLPTQAPQKPATKPVAPRQRVPETLANYLGGEGTKVLGKTHIAIDPIARQCEAKVLEIRYPMFGMHKNQPSADGPVRKQVAKVTVQILRLPALPGLAISELPGSIDETLKGLRNHLWHQHIYHEGTLTQLGGDCRAPRRRLLRLVGGSLHGINEVTKKEVASIDLSQATEVVDSNSRTGDDYDPYGARPRSFEIRFKDGESISFAADKDEDKLVWMDALRDLVGRVPPNPLWARVYSQHEQEQSRQRSKSSGPRKSSGPPKSSGPRKSSGARQSGVSSGA
ncbi:hypothetical protein CspeluHIS016_0801620 [Cutaneotrichosporon spelunceum]|uniref:PH domain-containing protein n=1 Tax=Cutaneotrichosporon spelunceum TaxID=1672016 RepID=A0AAD3YDW1_9TREE|nr:hypothetical protein CspeluHIS016_0801620 [Cutaneotrichosporon spelunceum]